MKRNSIIAHLVACVLVGGVIGVISGCGERESAEARGNRPETRKPGAKTARSVKVNLTYDLPVLAVSEEPSGKLVGSCAFLPMTVSRTESTAPLRVSFSEDVPSGTGDTIRNSLWKATLVAALQNESTLQGVCISLGFRGRYDGPSAGAVMCLAIMSALDGRDFPDDFAMTGALLPDGTVGLVGGVAEKLQAAAKNPKIKRVAVPAFERFVRIADNEWVDLFEYGKSLGLEVRPVESIFDAYIFLHRTTKVSRPRLSSILDCREGPMLEAKAAEVFASRYVALRGRLANLSSNDCETVTNDDAWDAINPDAVEKRFSEGAIFDALGLVSAADANLDAVLESTRFYDAYVDDFLKREDAAAGDPQKSLRERFLDEWPIDKQVAFLGGLREKVLELMRRRLEAARHDENRGGAGTGNAAADASKTWKGFVPRGASSDIEAQFRSFLASERAVADYRYLRDNVPARDELRKGIENGSRNVGDDLNLCREKLFSFIARQREKPCFAGVPLPIRNAGPGMDATLSLFLNAWSVVNDTFEADVVGGAAENLGVHKDSVRDSLIGQNIYYSAYDASRGVTKEFLGLYERTDRLTYPGWTKSCLLFNVAELLAEASTLLFEQDPENGNATYVAFAIGRARTAALSSIHTCHSRGIPCFGPVLLFQKAERLRATNVRNTAELLAAYWKATMISKALVMAFQGGSGPEQGFNGYSVQTTPTASGESRR